MNSPKIRTDARFPRHQALAELVAQATAAQQLAHDVLHVERVYRWCVALADAYTDQADVAGACGLVHDLVHIPKSHRDRPLGSERSAEAAGDLLVQVGYSTAEQGQVVEAVRTCSWSRGLEPESDLGRILQDADRLDAIGAIGIARCMTCAQEIGDADSALYHAEDPLFETQRALDDRHFALDHFQEKLLKLSASMHFEISRQEAQRRHQAMQHFLTEIARDVAAPGQAESCQTEG